MTSRRTAARLERLESKAPAQCGRVFEMTIDEDELATEERIAVFRRDQGMTDDDRLIVRVIVDPPFHPA